MAAGNDAFKYSGGSGAGDPAWRVVLAIGPSRRLEAWVACLAGAAVAVALFVPAPAFARAGLVAATLAAAVRAARRQACQEGPGAIRLLSVDLAGRVQAVGADGRPQPGCLAGGCFVAPWLTVVRWRPEGARFSRALVLAPDAVDAEAFRRLRVLLRWR